MSQPALAKVAAPMTLLIPREDGREIPFGCLKSEERQAESADTCQAFPASWRLLALVSTVLCMALYGSYCSLHRSQATNEEATSKALRGRALQQGPQGLELAALRAFRASVKDRRNALASWSGNDPCAFAGVRCQSPAAVVVGLDLSGLRLVGTISPKISDLRSLTFLRLSGNGFTGPLPDLSPLGLLAELDVSRNRLAGPFPRSVLQLRRLKRLNLSTNALQNQLPAEVFAMNLDVLAVDNNRFTAGPGLWQALQNSRASVIALGANPLGGSLSDNLATLGNTLQVLSLGGTSLTGDIPPSMGSLASATVIDLSDNRLEGTIPPTFLQLVNLVELNLASNLLLQDIGGLRPLLSLPRIQTIDVSDNFLTGTAGPVIMGSSILHASGNCIQNLPSQKDTSVCLGATNAAGDRSRRGWAVTLLPPRVEG